MRERGEIDKNRTVVSFVVIFQIGNGGAIMVDVTVMPTSGPLVEVTNSN